MQPELTANRHALVSKYVPRQTELARRRRLNRLVRELADDLGFQRVSMAEKAALCQLAALTLQIELMQAAIVRGEQIETDEMIRLSGEARRMLVGLRKRVKDRTPPRPLPLPPWSPMRERLSKPETEPAK